MNNLKRFRILGSILFCIGVTGTYADSLTIYVAPSGNDGNSGSREAPMRSLAAAQERIRPHAGERPAEVIAADGIYYLLETLTFHPTDSGTARAPILYRAENEGRAVISGGSQLSLDWQAAPEVGDGVYRAETPRGLKMDQLFVDGERQRMARYPNYNPALKTAAYQGFAADAFSKERAARWADPAGGYIHAMHRTRWGGYHYRITGKNTEGEVTYEGGWQNNRQMGMHSDFRMVENIFEELDAPGEWFHDEGARTLYFMPEPRQDLSQARIEVVRLRHLIEFQGTSTAPVRHISLEGFTFRHTARTFMETREPLLRSDWTIYRGGAILLTGTENISILDSTFDQVGGNAIFVNKYNRHALVRGCHIRNAGASGVLFVGDPEAVRDPLFEYAETQDLDGISLVPGPKTDNYPADSFVEDCLIHGIGEFERQPAGVQISMARRITVRDTSIYDCARAGINISEGTWGGHLIERCDVFDTVLETHDHGSFNSWGRDRYWNRKHRQITEPAVEANPRLPYLDAVETTILRNSRWRCDHGWAIDLDDGSANYEIYNNLLLAGGLKLREGYGRLAYNNIHINNGLHPHVWFENSGDRFTRNIVMAAHRPIRNAEDWGRASDLNHFAFGADLRKAWEQGADPRSTAGDPQFVDPAAGDFRVKPGSPALEVGFENFPMDQFGVKKPSLRAIARTPELPDLRTVSSLEPTQSLAALPTWMGVYLRGLQGEEFSAFGVSKEAGGVQIIANDPRALALRRGLQADDLIQKVNGQPIRTAKELLDAIEAAGSQPLHIVLVRSQQAIELTLE
jgi:hypothetical protein